MSPRIIVIDVSAITPLIVRLIAQLGFCDYNNLILKSWYCYHLDRLQALAILEPSLLELGNRLPSELKFGDDFAVKRLYRNSEQLVNPNVNSHFHDYCRMRMTPSGLILDYNSPLGKGYTGNATTIRQGENSATLASACDESDRIRSQIQYLIQQFDSAGTVIYPRSLRDYKSFD